MSGASAAQDPQDVRALTALDGESASLEAAPTAVESAPEADPRLAWEQIDLDDAERAGKANQAACGESQGTRSQIDSRDDDAGAGSVTRMNRPRHRFALASTTIVACLAFVATSAYAGDPCSGKSLTPGSSEIFIDFGGESRRFLLEVPPAAANGLPLPLVLNFHGVTSTPEATDAVSQLAALGVAKGFITATPAGYMNSWNAGFCCNPAVADGIDDVGFARAVVARVEQDYCVDPTRIHATGFSNGGAMTFRLACDASDLFASFAPVGGSLALLPCLPSEPRPILILNNIEDPVVSIDLADLSFDFFRDANVCTGTPAPLVAAPGTTCDSFTTTCADGVTTALCKTEVLGHIWPGGAFVDPNGAFDASQAVWDFFETEYVPEPAISSMTMAGIVTMAWLGRTRRRA